MFQGSVASLLGLQDNWMKLPREPSLENPTYPSISRPNFATAQVPGKSKPPRNDLGLAFRGLSG